MFEFAEKKREDLLRYTGRIEQIAGLTRFTYADGNAKGIPACRVRTGSGLDFTVLEGRNLEIYDLSYKGINLAFLYKNGLMSAARIPIAPNEFLSYSSGGMMYTSGLLNSGPENIAEGLFQPLHGRISLASAEQISSCADFDEDGNYQIRLSGRTQESRLFQHQLVLHRTISSKLNSNRIEVEDLINNDSCRDVDFALMYHINFGYPFLDKGTRIIVPEGTESEARNEHSQNDYEQRFEMTEAIDNFAEHLYYHRLPADSEGNCEVKIRNEKLRLQVTLRYNAAVMPWLVEWKSMGSGDYALGVMPSTSSLLGRKEELERNGLTRIAPYQSCKLGFRFEIEEI